MMVCWNKMFNGEIIFHLKRRLKRLCNYKWRAWYKLSSSSGWKKIVHISFIHQSSFWEEHEVLPFGTKYCVAILWKGTDWKSIFPWRKINWHVSKIAKAHFSYTIYLWHKCFFTMVVHTCTKTLSKQGIQKKNKCLQKFPILLALIYYLHVYLWFYLWYLNMYILTDLQKKRISKHSGKKIIQLIWSVVTCLMLNMELNMILIVLVEFACIRHSWTLR